jgi:flagellar biosynthesis protein FlhF
LKAQKFQGKTSREALALVRAELGDEAVILSSKRVDDRVEILAVPAEDIDAITDQASERPVKRRGAESILSPNTVTPSQSALDTGSSIPASIYVERAASALKKVVAESRSQDHMLGFIVADKRAETNSGLEPNAWAENLLGEVRAMRSQMAQEIGQLAWREVRTNEPGKAEFTRHMLSVGFSGKLTKQLLRLTPGVTTYRDLLAQAGQILVRNVSHLQDEASFIEDGGIYALVGPTGVGKTTTTAKLAARCVVRHGPQNVAIITTDGYRIGSHEQIRIYAKLLGVSVIAVRDSVDLKLAMRDCAGKKMVLIDTVGMSQRDAAVAEQAATLAAAGATVKRLLVLAANSSGNTLDEVISAYQAGGLHGTIITKLDEASTLGQLVDAVVRNRLPVYFMANGQRVPEDLHVAHGPYLVDKALRTRPARSAFDLLDDDVTLLMTGAPPTEVPLVPLGLSA